MTICTRFLIIYWLYIHACGLSVVYVHTRLRIIYGFHADDPLVAHGTANFRENILQLYSCHRILTMQLNSTSSAHYILGLIATFSGAVQTPRITHGSSRVSQESILHSSTKKNIREGGLDGPRDKTDYNGQLQIPNKVYFWVVFWRDR